MENKTNFDQLAQILEPAMREILSSWLSKKRVDDLIAEFEYDLEEKLLYEHGVEDGLTLFGHTKDQG